MAPTDSVFLLAESREHPMHVGGLTLFQPPEGAGPEFVREFTDAMVANDEFQPTFRKRPARVMGGIPPLAWAYDDNADIDVDYHIRRSALAGPGRVRGSSSWHRGCTPVCSIGTARCGSCTWWRA